MFTIAMMMVSGWTLVHDYRRPDLNEWYAGLHRKGSSFGCCSKEDCHTTEAQLHNGVWWARIGKPVDHQDGSRDWILGNYVRIPGELIVKGDDGLPVRNPEGEAVVRHSKRQRNRSRAHDIVLHRAWPAIVKNGRGCEKGPFAQPASARSLSSISRRRLRTSSSLASACAMP